MQMRYSVRVLAVCMMEAANVDLADLVRSITDPEHPLTLEQLAVVSAEQIEVVHGDRPKVNLVFTPTIPHCR